MKAIALRIARRALFFAIFVIVTQVVAGVWATAVEPAVTAELTLHSVNGGYTEHASVRLYHYFSGNALPAAYIVGLILVFIPALTGLINKYKPE